MLLLRMLIPFVLVVALVGVIGGVVFFNLNPKHDQNPALSNSAASIKFREGMDQLVKTQYAGALASFDQTLSFDPKFAAAYAGRAQTFNILGDFQAAVDSCNQAIALDPKFAAAYANRAAAFYWLGQYQKSLDDAQTCERLNDSHFPKAITHVCLAAANLGMKNFSAALDNANQAIALAPASPNPYSVRAKVELAQKQYEQSLSDCDKALKLFPRMAHVYDTRSDVYKALGKMDLSDADHNKAKAILDEDAAILARIQTRRSLAGHMFALYSELYTRNLV